LDTKNTITNVSTRKCYNSYLIIIIYYYYIAQLIHGLAELCCVSLTVSRVRLVWG
jgi:hypothetical protein